MSTRHARRVSFRVVFGGAVPLVSQLARERMDATRVTRIRACRFASEPENLVALYGDTSAKLHMTAAQK